MKTIFSDTIHISLRNELADIYFVPLIDAYFNHHFTVVYMWRWWHIWHWHGTYHLLFRRFTWDCFGHVIQVVFFFLILAWLYRITLHKVVKFTFSEITKKFHIIRSNVWWGFTKSKKCQQNGLLNSISEISFFCRIENPNIVTFACQMSKKVLQTLVIANSSVVSLLSF